MEGPYCSGAGDKNVRSRRAHRVWCLWQGSSSAAPGSSTCAVVQQGRGQLPLAVAWLGKRSSGTELGHGCSTHCQTKLLLEFPQDGVPLSSGQLRRLMAVCLSEEGWCFTELGLRTVGQMSPVATDFLWSPCNEAIYPARGWALSPITEPKPWMEHSWPPHQASHSLKHRCGTV